MSPILHSPIPISRKNITVTGPEFFPEVGFALAFVPSTCKRHRGYDIALIIYPADSERHSRGASDMLIVFTHPVDLSRILGSTFSVEEAEKLAKRAQVEIVSRGENIWFALCITRGRVHLETTAEYRESDLAAVV